MQEYPLGNPAFKPAAAAGLLAVAAAFALAPLWGVLHSQWTEVATYAHGYLLSGMAAWLAWRSWRLRPPALLAPSWQWLPAFALVVLLLAAFEWLFLNVPRAYLLPPLLITCTGFVFGREAALRLMWPALLLYWALPVWVSVNPLLQALTTSAVSSGLSWSGIPAFIEGNFVHLPAGTFEIAEECSGLRYLIIGTTLAVFYALAFLETWRRRLLLAAIAAAVMIVCNWIRVYTVIVAGHVTEMQHYLVAVEHNRFGWVLFALSLIPVLWVARRLEPSRLAAPQAEAGSAVAPGSAIAPGHGVLAAALVAALLLAVPRLSLLGASAAHATADASLPGSLIRDDGAASPWQPVFLNALEDRGMIAAVAAPIDVYRAVYPRQDADHRLVRYGNGFVAGEWRAVAEDIVPVRTRAGYLDVVEYDGYAGGRRRIVWGWYWVAGEPATNVVQIKALELKGLLAGRRDAAAVAVSAECRSDCDETRRRLAVFLDESLESLKWRP